MILVVGVFLGFSRLFSGVGEVNDPHKGRKGWGILLVLQGFYPKVLGVLDQPGSDGLALFHFLKGGA